MNVKSLLTAAAVLIATGTAVAAESPQAPADAVSAGAAAVASPSSLPTARDEAKRNAADAVKHYKTPLAIQLEQYKN